MRRKREGEAKSRSGETYLQERQERLKGQVLPEICGKLLDKPGGGMMSLKCDEVGCTCHYATHDLWCRVMNAITHICCFVQIVAHTVARVRNCRHYTPNE